MSSEYAPTTTTHDNYAQIRTSIGTTHSSSSALPISLTPSRTANGVRAGGTSGASTPSTSPSDTENSIDYGERRQLFKRSRSGESDHKSGIGGEVDESAIAVEGEDRVNAFVWILVFTAALSGLLFGYDTAAISGVLVIIGDDLGKDLTTWQTEMVTSATTLGALVGGLIAGGLSDFTGRKLVIILANVVFIAGSICQAACRNVSAMVAGRFIVGLGVGLASCIVPLYIGELSPTKLRGRLVTMNAVVVTLGQVIAYAIGAAFQHVPKGWRYIVGLGAVPAIVQLCAMGFLPESPRILLLRSKVDKARSILAKIYPLATSTQVDQKVEIMRAAVQQTQVVNEQTTWLERLRSLVMVGTNRRGLIIGCGLQALQQLCGFNTLMYYSATIFAMLGFRNATAVGLIVATVNFLFTLVSLRLVDPIGRRKTLLFTVPIMIVSLSLAAIFFHFLTKSTGGILVSGSDYPKSWSILVLLSMLLYVAGYATGLGNIPWQQGELFKLEVRGIGTSISTATNWSCNLLISATFLSLMNAATPSGAFGLYAGLCTLGWMFCYLLYPETSGLSLEEVFIVFEDGFGVERSYELRREKQEKERVAVLERLGAGSV
ncbi:hypothetical protein CI109_101974 [Kwoniella shandongensis]|uniref:Uncharacterized protein n=1 Tax=Kwoniella shandongensis TaxID=1734106 RepID=A0A5M6BVX4_9TREE|nr:uncharacterized protein CI109_005364 [Kwoniella shandongensis]KAA5526240.1 hypothetical protein CI109_005364 [Kwoniella shandongensis]